MKEIPIKYLLQTLTVKRIVNAALALSSIAAAKATKKAIRWGRPFILTVEPTNLCNLRCPLCVTGNGKMARQSGSMTFETFKTLIDETSDYLFYLLLYQQGEPFINRESLRFVEYAKARRIFVTTSSNGHYFDEETARATVMSGLDSIIVSIDGARQATYEKYRIGGRLDKVCDGVQNLVAEKRRQHSKTPVIYVQFIAMKHNQHELTEMKKLARKLGADRLLIKKVQVETMAEAAEWLPQKESLRRYRAKDNILYAKNSGKGLCPRPWTSALINWDGTVVPCCFDKNAKHVTGEISDKTTLMNAWHSVAYDSFRTKMLTNRNGIDICANCSQGLKLFA